MRLVTGLAVLGSILSACGDDEGVSADSGADGGDAMSPDAGMDADGSAPVESSGRYEFESVLQPGVSTVAYDGQVLRQLLISELRSEVDGVSARIDAGTLEPVAAGDVFAFFDFYLRFDSASYGQEAFRLTTEPALVQAVWDDISTNKDIVGKMAGNDVSTDHRDWSTEFVGWSDESIAMAGGSVDSPEGLVTAWLMTVDARALARANGTTDASPDGEVLPAHITPSGLHLGQLTEKFLTMAVSFSQGTDDYLDDDVAGKGILSPNTLEDGKPWTVLAHQWDEAFGYFGPSRDYGEYTPAQLAESRFRDTNQDGAIDLQSEYNYSHARYLALRDADAVVSEDFMGEAFGALLAGRQLIASVEGELSEAQLNELRGHRDRAVTTWEAGMGATVIYYLNRVLEHMGRFGTEDYSFATHAGHWSEMKGFALGFQFNPDSPLLQEVVILHELMRDAPVLETASVEAVAAYRADLVEARGILAQAYGFDAANVGDANGANGW